MDSYITYLQITSAESGRASLLQLSPSPYVYPFFPLWTLFAANAGGGDLCFYIGGSLPPHHRAVGLPAAPPPGGRGFHVIKL